MILPGSFKFRCCHLTENEDLFMMIEQQGVMEGPHYTWCFDAVQRCTSSARTRLHSFCWLVTGQSQKERAIHCPSAHKSPVYKRDAK